MMAGIATGLLATVLITGGFASQSVAVWAKPTNSSQSILVFSADPFAQAESQQHQGNWLEAIATYKTVLTNPDSTALQQAQAAYQIGRLHRQLRQFIDAIPYLERAQAKYQEADDTLGEAEVLTELAYIYLLFGRETIGYEQTSAAEALLQVLPDRPTYRYQRLQAEISRNQTSFHYLQADYSAALAAVDTTISHYQSLVNNPALESLPELRLQHQRDLVLQQRNVGLFQFSQQDFDNAFTTLTNVVEDLDAIYSEYQRLENTTGATFTQFYLCETYSLVGLAQSALPYCQAALTTLQDLKYTHWVGPVLKRISDSYGVAEPADVGLQTEAEIQGQVFDFWQQAIAAAQSAEDTWKAAEYQLGFGDSYWTVGRYDHAFALYDQALTTYKTLAETPYGDILGAPYLVGKSLMARGNIFYQRGNYIAALEDYLQAKDIYGSLHQLPLATLEEKRSLGYAYLDMGKTYERLARYGDAIASLEKALAIGREFNEPFTESMALDALANISSDLGESDQQTTLSTEADNVRDQILDYRIGSFEAPDFSTTLSPEEELAAAQAANNRQTEAYAYSAIGLAAYRDNEYEQALVAYNQAIVIHEELGDWPAVAITWDLVGQSYRDAGQLDEAISAFQQALALHRQTGEGYQVRTTLQSIAYVYVKQEQPELAIAFYKEAVNVSEALRDELETLPLARQESYVQSVEATYRFLADLLLEQGRILEAQQVLELLKVQEIRNYIDDQRAVNSASGVTLLPQEETLLISHGSLVEFGKTVSQCEQSRCDQLSQLRNQRDDLARAYQENVDKLASFIREQLAADQALLDPEDLGGQAREILKQQPGTVVIYP